VHLQKENHSCGGFGSNSPDKFNRPLPVPTHTDKDSKVNEELVKEWTIGWPVCNNWSPKYPPNTILHDTRHDSSSYATHAAQIPSGRCELVRPALFRVSVGVSEPYYIRDIKY